MNIKNLKDNLKADIFVINAKGYYFRIQPNFLHHHGLTKSDLIATEGLTLFDTVNELYQANLDYMDSIGNNFSDDIEDIVGTEISFCKWPTGELLQWEHGPCRFEEQLEESEQDNFVDYLVEFVL